MILPGAVAKGAFEAGVIHALACNGTRVDRIIATSSGALNGVAYAAGIRCGREKEMTEKLIQAWIENGGWQNSLSLDPRNWFMGRGLSDRAGLLKMLNDLVVPCTLTGDREKRREIELRIIVAPLNGVKGAIGRCPATTFEKLLHFSGKDFDTPEGLAGIFDATTAACAFPGLYAPVELKGLGPCVDGGTVNNAPIKYALDECDVGQVIMPVPFPAIMTRAKSLNALTLMNHMIDVLVNERLYRDLKDAQMVNDEVSKLEKLVSRKVLNKKQFEAVKSALLIRKIKIIEIRPSRSLRGNPFSGFFSKKDRIRLVNEGRRAAQRQLKENPKL